MLKSESGIICGRHIQIRPAFTTKCIMTSINLFVLLSAERHLAVKYSFLYDNLVTEVRIIIASGVGCDHVKGCETLGKWTNLIARCCINSNYTMFNLPNFPSWRQSMEVKITFLCIITSKFICFYTNVNYRETQLARR